MPDRTPAPWWTCPHSGVSLPGCPLCDPRLDGVSRKALLEARQWIDLAMVALGRTERALKGVAANAATIKSQGHGEHVAITADFVAGPAVRFLHEIRRTG